MTTHFPSTPERGFLMKRLHRPGQPEGAEHPESEIRGIRHHSVRIHESNQDHRERYERARKGRTKSTGQQTDYVRKLKTAQTYG